MGILVQHIELVFVKTLGLLSRFLSLNHKLVIDRILSIVLRIACKLENLGT